MKLVVLGCGNMSSALLRHVTGFQIFTYDPILSRAEELAAATQGKVFENLEQLPWAEIYLIGCKPQQFEQLAEQLTGRLPEEASVVSIMAGVDSKKLRESLGVESIIRVMPNTPALVGEGVSGVYFTPEVPSMQRQLLEKTLEKVSSVFVFPTEDMIDVITGFSGSGPAYIFEIARIMIDKLKEMGMTHVGASKLIKQTILGAAHLMEDNDPLQLREMVTSRKGVTEAALDVFNSYQLERIFSEALDAAYKRALALAK